jgi:hypothetical protein
MMGWDNTSPGTFKINGTSSAFADNAHFCITGSGLIGFGTEQPGIVNNHAHSGGSTGGLIHLKGNLPRIIFDDDDDTPQWAIDAQDYFGVWHLNDSSTAETRVFKIESSGNAIFTNTGTDLTVHADCSSGVSYFKADSGANTNAGMQIAENGTTRWTIANDGDASDNLIIEASGSGGVAMTVLQNGNVGIGTNAPTDFYPCLQVEGTQPAVVINDNNSDGFWSMIADGGNSNLYFDHSGAVRYLTATNTGGSSGTLTFVFNNNGTAEKSSGAGDWAGISDIRVKKNIEDLNIDALNVLNTLRPVEFNWKEEEIHDNPKDSDGKSYGFIADEIESIMPQLVTTSEVDKDSADREYLDEDGVAKKTELGIMASLYIKAIQQLTEKIEHIEKTCKCMKEE